MRTGQGASGRRWDRRTVQLLLLAASGVLLLVVSSWPFSRQTVPPPDAGVPGTAGRGHELVDYQQQLGRQLESILSLVQGAGRVRVQITLAESPSTGWPRTPSPLPGRPRKGAPQAPCARWTKVPRTSAR